MNNESSKNSKSIIPGDELERIRLKYRALFNETSDAIFLIDINGNHFEVNENASKMLGYSVEELQNISFREIVHETELENAEGKLEALHRGEKLPLYTRTFKRKDGTLFPAELNVALIRDDNGNPLYIQSIARDITERIRLETNLRESEERYRLLADNVKDILATLNMHLEFTFVSPSVTMAFGYEIDELLGKGIKEFLTPDSFSEVMKALSEALRLEEEVGKDGYAAPPMELEIYHKEGNLVWVEVSRVFLRDIHDSPIGLLIVIRDITERVRAEQRIASTNRDLELYASLLRHDLRNDLQVILTQAESAHTLLPDDATIMNYCETTGKLAERMNRLLEIFSTPSLEIPNNIVDLLNPMISEFEQVYPGLIVKIDMKSEKKDLEITQGRLIPALFTNLVRNSLQHGGNNVQVSITLQRKDDMIQIDFSNNGPPIDKSILPQLFQRGASTTGGGLGLYLCRRITEAYGGEITLLDSENGVTFRIKFPVN